MSRPNPIPWLVCLALAAAAAAARGQDPPAPAAPAAAPSVPVTVDIDVAAIRDTTIQKLRQDKDRQGLPAYLGKGKTNPLKLLAGARPDQPPGAGSAETPPGPAEPPRRKLRDKLRDLGRLKQKLKELAAGIDLEFEYQLWLERFDLRAEKDELTGVVEVRYRVQGVPGEGPRILSVLTELSGEGTVRVPFTWRIKPGEDGSVQLEGLTGALHVVSANRLFRALLNSEFLQKAGFHLLRNRLDKEVARHLPDQFRLSRRVQKMNEPKRLGENLWLVLNIREVLVGGLHAEADGRHLALRLATRQEPVILLAQDRPPAPPLPRFAWPPALPAAPPAGVTLDFLLKLDPQSLPGLLPPEAHKEVAKYGLDIAQVKLRRLDGPGPERIQVTAPIQQPVQGLLKVAATPHLQDNVLTFLKPECTLETPAAPKGKEDSFAQALQNFSRNAVCTLAVAKLTAARVDFGPHLRKIQTLAADQEATTGKFRAAIADLRVLGLAVRDDRLLVTIRGRLGPEGIRLLEP